LKLVLPHFLHLTASPSLSASLLKTSLFSSSEENTFLPASAMGAGAGSPPLLIEFLPTDGFLLIVCPDCDKDTARERRRLPSEGPNFMLPAVIDRGLPPLAGTGDVLRGLEESLSGVSVIDARLLKLLIEPLPSKLWVEAMLWRQDEILSGELWLRDPFRKIPVPIFFDRIDAVSQESFIRLVAAQSCLKILIRPV
jgi:hypothetical protein